NLQKHKLNNIYNDIKKALDERFFYVRSIELELNIELREFFK
ncbi:MAG: hypothetical protein RL751_1970, partial [Bacteroidota bacterium]